MILLRRTVLPSGVFFHALPLLKFAQARCLEAFSLARAADSVVSERQILLSCRNPSRSDYAIRVIDASALPAGRWHLRFKAGHRIRAGWAEEICHRSTRLALAAVFLIARTSLGVLLMNIGPPRSKLARTCPPFVFRGSTSLLARDQTASNPRSRMCLVMMQRPAYAS